MWVSGLVSSHELQTGNTTWQESDTDFLHGKDLDFIKIFNNFVQQWL